MIRWGLALGSISSTSLSWLSSFWAVENVCLTYPSKTFFFFVEDVSLLWLSSVVVFPSLQKRWFSAFVKGVRSCVGRCLLTSEGSVSTNRRVHMGNVIMLRWRPVRFAEPGPRADPENTTIYDLWPGKAAHNWAGRTRHYQRAVEVQKKKKPSRREQMWARLWTIMDV